MTDCKISGDFWFDLSKSGCVRNSFESWGTEVAGESKEYKSLLFSNAVRRSGYRRIYSFIFPFPSGINTKTNGTVKLKILKNKIKN